MKLLVLATSMLAVCFGNDSDDSSLLQMQKQKRSLSDSHRSSSSTQTTVWQKTMLSISATSARCGCRMLGCGLTMCMPCAPVECMCNCVQIVEQCPTCCNQDRDCIEQKIKKSAKRAINKLDNDEKHKVAVAKYRRKIVETARTNEDLRWDHLKASHEHLKELRAAEDGKWKQQKASHKEVKKGAKLRKKDYKEWSSDLSGVVEGVLHELNGGLIIDMAPFQIDIMDCDCPDEVNCPPNQECPTCQQECPPCKPCESQPADCDACEEDKPVQDFVQRWLKDHPWAMIVEDMSGPIELPPIQPDMP